MQMYIHFWQLLLNCQVYEVFFRVGRVSPLYVSDSDCSFRSEKPKGAVGGARQHSEAVVIFWAFGQGGVHKVP